MAAGQVTQTGRGRSLGKDADGPVSRWLNRPLSTRLSMILAPLRPAPDLVSLIAFMFGLAGAALLATGQGPGQGLAGGLLVHASSVADGVNGEVARLQLRGGPRGALLDGLLDRVGDAAILAGLGLWALDGPGPRGVLVLTVAATTGALLSMASKDRAVPLGLPPAPERPLGWLLGGRDGRLLLVAVGAVLGAPVAALAAVTATSTLSLGLRVAFVRHPVGLTARHHLANWGEAGLGCQLRRGQAAGRLRGSSVAVADRALL